MLEAEADSCAYVKKDQADRHRPDKQSIGSRVTSNAFLDCHLDCPVEIDDIWIGMPLNNTDSQGFSDCGWTPFSVLMVGRAQHIVSVGNW